MNSIDKYKNCSNCKKSYEISMYISSKCKSESIVYTKVCQKCRQKNKTSSIKKKMKNNKKDDNTELIPCTNCHTKRPEECFISKTGKRILKVCSVCRNPSDKSKKKKEEKTVAEIGIKFTCTHCKNEFIKSNLFGNIDREKCSKCIQLSS